MNPKPERFRLQLILLLAGLIAAGLLLAGCKGVPTKSERQSRADLKAVTEAAVRR